MEDYQLISDTHDWNKIAVEFDEKKWEDLLNSDDILDEQYSKCLKTKKHSNVNNNHTDIIKLSVNDSKRSTFLNSNKFIHTGRSMMILIPPSSTQRVRYENECKKIHRSISVPDNKTLTLEIPDLRDILTTNDVLWLRITRTTIDHRKDRLIFYHPYPIWIKDKTAKIHNGSIFIQVTNKDMENRFIKIDTLAILRLKQDILAKLNMLEIYSSTQLDSVDSHLIEVKTPKRIRDEYKLQQSILNFQLVQVDENNVAYLTDCLCQTDSLQEIEAHGQQNITRKRKTFIMD